MADTNNTLTKKEQTLQTPLLSKADSERDLKNATANNAAGWMEYSKFHDSFTELLYYENKRGFHSDIWQLNYI